MGHKGDRVVKLGTSALWSTFQVAGIKELHTCQPDWADSSLASVWILLAEHNPAYREGHQTSSWLS